MVPDFDQIKYTDDYLKRSYTFDDLLRLTLYATLEVQHLDWSGAYSLQDKWAIYFKKALASQESITQKIFMDGWDRPAGERPMFYHQLAGFRDGSMGNLCHLLNERIGTHYDLDMDSRDITLNQFLKIGCEHLAQAGRLIGGIPTQLNQGSRETGPQSPLPSRREQTGGNPDSRNEQVQAGEPDRQQHQQRLGGKPQKPGDRQQGDRQQDERQQGEKPQSERPQGGDGLPFRGRR